MILNVEQIIRQNIKILVKGIPEALKTACTFLINSHRNESERFSTSIIIKVFISGLAIWGSSDGLLHQTELVPSWFEFILEMA